MVKAAFVTGLAGAGKTWITYSIYEWFRNIKQDVATLNLDPGVTNLPYKPDVDIREYINIWTLMEKYNVGPNGALMLAMDLLLDYVERINSKIGELNPELILIDTPGQIEVFAYRASGKIFVDLLTAENKMILFVIDSVFVKDPRNFVSNYMIGGSIKARFSLPMLAVLNKIDLISDNLLKKILKWIKKSYSLKADLEEHYPSEESDYLFHVYRLLKRYGLFQDFIPVSAMYLNNFEKLIQAITRVLFRGEEYFML